MNLYEGWVAAFEEIYARCEQDLACFYEQSGAIAALPRDERNALLAALGERAAT